MECPGCQIEFEPTSKRQKYCTPACADRHRKRRYYEAHRQTIIDRSAAWAKANPDRQRDYDRLQQWRAANPTKGADYARTYRERDGDKLRDRNRKWMKAKRDDDPDALDKERAYRKANREAIQKARREYVKANLDKYRTYARKRRAQKRQAPIESVDEQAVFARWDWHCQLCGLPIDPLIAWPDPMSPTLDHIQPLARGGTHSESNLQPAHLGCNSAKGAKYGEAPHH